MFGPPARFVPLVRDVVDLTTHIETYLSMRWLSKRNGDRPIRRYRGGLGDKTFFLRGANDSTHTAFSELDFVSWHMITANFLRFICSQNAVFESKHIIAAFSNSVLIYFAPVLFVQESCLFGRVRLQLFARVPFVRS
jgi:hypothetical protein